MFPNTSIEELTSDRIYQFDSTTPVYLALMAYYADLFDYRQKKARWQKYSPEVKTESLWWVMNESWKSYGTVRPNTPIHWLAISKRALQLDHVPSNFHPWALAILDSFDLPRYQAAYQLPLEEYAAIAQDLPQVLDGLRHYPQEKLAPPIDENDWGYSDQ